MSELSNSFWPELVREPLLHFLVMGSALFALASWLDQPESKTILVTDDMVAQRVKSREDLSGQSLSDEDRAHLIEELVVEEVLVREAYRIGLDRNDPRIRQRLLDKMRFMLNEPIEEPNEKQLREYFQQHKDQYLTLESLTLIHAFFPPAYAEQLRRRTPTILKHLRSGTDHRTFGEPFGLGPELSERSRFDLRQLFGNESAATIWALPDGEWSGPIESTYGFHFVKVVARHPAQHQSFESVVMYLRQDWLLTKQREIHKPKIAEKMRKYKIVVEPEIETNQ